MTNRPYITFSLIIFFRFTWRAQHIYCKKTYVWRSRLNIYARQFDSKWHSLDFSSGNVSNKPWGIICSSNIKNLSVSIPSSKLRYSTSRDTTALIDWYRIMRESALTKFWLHLFHYLQNQYDYLTALKDFHLPKNNI